MTDLVISGGTVVTAERSFAADVAIRDGRISEIGPGLGRQYPDADTLDARKLLVLPGCVDVHTHTRLPIDGGAGPLLPGQRGGGLRRHHHLPGLQQPGHRHQRAGERVVAGGLEEFRARTEGEAAVDFALSSVISGQQPDPLAEIPELIARGVPTAKAFMVYDFRLPDDRLFAVLQVMGRHGGMLQVHCENATIIDALVSGALEAGRIECRHHAACRPTYAEAEATHRAIALARAADASVYVVHLSCADALAEVVGGQGPRLAGLRRDLPALPVTNRCGLRGR